MATKKKSSAGSQHLIDEALDAFWHIVAEAYPGATTGDLSPLMTMRMQEAAEAAVKEWLENNLPARKKKPASAVTSATHTPGPWFVDRLSTCSAICIKPYPGPIVCDIDGTDAEAEANAALIAATPDGYELALSMKNACEEHLSTLNDEMVAGRPGADDDELDDLQTQIDNWSYLLEKCDTYLTKANGNAA